MRFHDGINQFLYKNQRDKKFKNSTVGQFMETRAHFCGHFYENLAKNMSTKEENNCIEDTYPNLEEEKFNI